MSSITYLSNEELELRLKDFVSKERFLLHIILDHIKEVDRRKLYLEKAYSSLFEYLVKELGYSGSAALRRQEAAQLLVEIPQLGHKIQNGSINLSQIGELFRGIKQKEKLNYAKTKNRAQSRVTTYEKMSVILSIEGQSKSETQKIISKAWDLPLQLYDTERTQKDESVRLEVTLTQEQYSQLSQCKDLAIHALKRQNCDASWSSVFAYLAQQYLSKYEIKNRKKRLPTSSDTLASSKESSHAIVTNQTLVPTASPLHASKSSKNPLSGNRNSVTQKTRREVLARDLSCQYKDPQTGQLCGSTFALQVDHKTPQWTRNFQDHENLHRSTNLQILCARHNRYKYQKECHIH